jgi:serine/threonine protein kinase
MQLSRKVQSMGELSADPRSRLVRTHFVSEKDRPADFFLRALNRNVQLHCIVQDLCAGGDLYQYMDGESFPEGVARHFFAELIHGINELHCRSIYHLDIKIENVLVVKDQASGEYSLRLGDMGFMRLFSMDSKRLDSEPATALHLVAAKNEAVLPPENLVLQSGGLLAFNTGLDTLNPAKADIWAAGEVLLSLVGFKSLYARKLYDEVRSKEGRFFKKLMVRLKEKPIRRKADGSWEHDMLDDLQNPRLGPAPLSISPALLDLLRCMLQSDRDQRPTAKQVLTKLTALSDTLSVAVPVSSPTDISFEMNKRFPKNLTDGARNAQTYDGTCSPPACGLCRAPPNTLCQHRREHVFRLLRTALGKQSHGWDIDYRDPKFAVIIEYLEHIVVCQVLRDGKIHCKWEKGMSSTVWRGIYLGLKYLLDNEPGFTTSAPK